jgi:hypothetical protein
MGSAFNDVWPVCGRFYVFCIRGLNQVARVGGGSPLAAAGSHRAGDYGHRFVGSRCGKQYGYGAG